MPARSTANRVQGIDSSVEDLVIRATGRKLALEVGPGIIPIPKLTRTINGASSVELEVEDPERRLLRHSLVSSKWDIELDSLHFRYPGGLSKKGDLLTLTLEDRWIALLREKKGPKRVVRGSGKGQMTRAEFIKMLVEEACGKGLDFYCPQLHVQQPIQKPSQAKKAKEEAKEKRRKGIGDVKGLKVKGQAASASQRELGDMALRIAESVKAPDVVQVALIAALIDENDMSGPNCLQAEPFTAEGASTPAAKEISGFLTGKPKWTGTTAIGYYKAHPTAKFYEIAQAVQGSGAGEGSNGKANYGQFGKEAEEWVEARNGGELSESINVTEPYEFKVAKKEDYWSAIKELAKEVNWRAFIVGDRFFFVPEPELLQGMVRLAIDDNTPGIETIDFDYEGNNPVTEVEVEALVGQWKVPPGAVVTLSDYGPASVGFGDAPVKKDKKGQKAGLSGNRNANTKEGTARLILSSIEVPLSDEPAQRVATIKLHRPTAPLPEPAAETKSISTHGSSGYVNPFPSGWTRGRIDMGVDFGYTKPGAQILAIGEAHILPVPAGEAHWEGGKGVLYELIGGSQGGKCIYVYEGINPLVSPGQTVKAGTVIGTGGITGSIEIGFANSNGEPLAAPEYMEGKETKAGKEMSKFLDEIGAP